MPMRSMFCCRIKLIIATMDKLAKEHQATLLIFDERTIDGYVPGIRKIIKQPMFEKLTTPEMDHYREYSFSIYKIQSEMIEIT